VVLVTLGSCHLLDGLVACDSIEACEKIVRCSEEGFVRGIVLAPRKPRRATLIERDVKDDKWSGRVNARACGKHSTWESVTYGSPLVRGPAATLELVSTGTSVLATT
jgi:hypothetical protein